MDSTLRPMSTGQVLDRTFHLYRNNFLLFAGIAALPPAVFLLGQAGFFLLELIPAPRLEFLASGLVFAAGIAGLVVLYLLALSFAIGATVYAVSRVHLGQPVKIGESYKVIRPLLWRITRIWLSVAIRFAGAVLAAVAVLIVPIILMRMITGRNSSTPAIVSWAGGLLVIGAFVVCFIWSLRLYCSYQLAVPACVLERLGAVACLKRSRFLSKGKTVQRILLVLFLSLILTYVLSLAFSIPLYIALAVGAADRMAALAIPIALWQYVSGFVAGTLAGPIATIAVALLYYDERVRKEAFDLQLMMDAVGQQQQVNVAAPPTIG